MIEISKREFRNILTNCNKSTTVHSIIWTFTKMVIIRDILVVMNILEKEMKNSDFFLLTHPRDESGTMGQARFHLQSLDTSWVLWPYGTSSITQSLVTKRVQRHPQDMAPSRWTNNHQSSLLWNLMKVPHWQPLPDSLKSQNKQPMQTITVCVCVCCECMCISTSPTPFMSFYLHFKFMTSSWIIVL